MRFLIRWLIGAIAVAAAVYFVPGISIVGEKGWLVVMGMALILGLVNAFIRPLLTILSCGFIVLTLGLFMLVVNGLSFFFASQIAQNWFGIGFQVDGLCRHLGSCCGEHCHFRGLVDPAGSGEKGCGKLEKPGRVK